MLAVKNATLAKSKKGNIANLIIVDHKFSVKKTIFEGQLV